MSGSVQTSAGMLPGENHNLALRVVVMDGKFRKDGRSIIFGLGSAHLEKWGPICSSILNVWLVFVSRFVSFSVFVCIGLE